MSCSCLCCKSRDAEGGSPTSDSAAEPSIGRDRNSSENREGSESRSGENDSDFARNDGGNASGIHRSHNGHNDRSCHYAYDGRTGDGFTANDPSACNTDENERNSSCSSVYSNEKYDDEARVLGSDGYGSGHDRGSYSGGDCGAGGGRRDGDGTFFSLSADSTDWTPLRGSALLGPSQQEERYSGEWLTGSPGEKVGASPLFLCFFARPEIVFRLSHDKCVERWIPFQASSFAYWRTYVHLTLNDRSRYLPGFHDLYVMIEIVF